MLSLPTVRHAVLGAVLTATGFLPAAAYGHYLWVTVTKDTAEVVFEESPRKGDGHYLGPLVKRGRTWLRTTAQPEPAPLKMSDTREGELRWLSAALPKTDAPSRAVESTGKWGVYRYGSRDILLYYYAKFLQVTRHEDLHELGRAEQLRLDIVPHDEPDGVQFKVLFDGKPQADRPVSVRGPQGFRKQLKTDKRGRVQFTPPESGRYTIHSSVELPEEAGEFEGKPYQSVRHHATLTLDFPIEE